LIAKPFLGPGPSFSITLAQSGWFYFKGFLFPRRIKDKATKSCRETKDQIMKTFLMALTMAAALAPATQLQAQYKHNGADGVAASPKLREMLESRRTVASAPATVITVNDGIVASPKLRERLDSEKTIPTSTSAMAIDLAHPQNTDVVVASPKLREQMGTRSPRFEIAPIK
jgi:hypothetical protein